MSADRHESWHLITGEYPPDHGGVSDYTQLVAARLAAEGCEVHVWCRGDEPTATEDAPGLTVHRIAGTFDRSGLRRLSHSLDSIPGRRILFVQYVPPAFGLRAMNVPFCLWIRSRRRSGDEVRVMFHEVAFPFVRRPLKWNLLAIVQRAMAAIVLRAASKVYVSAAAWIPYLRRLGLGEKPAIVLPVPSNFPSAVAQERIEAARRRLAVGGSAIAGHFGTYGAAITTLLTPILRRLLTELPSLSVALIGRGSTAYRGELIAADPADEHRLSAFDDLTRDEVSAQIQACDLMLQPFPDGASSRRTSLMACLAAAAPVVTTYGDLSEPVWQTQRVCAAVAVRDDAAVVEIAKQWLSDPQLRRSVGSQAAAYYQAHFSLDRTIEILLDRANAPAAHIPKSAVADQ